MTDSITIRKISGVEEMRAVEELQREVWGFSDREITPAMSFVAATEVGAVLLGAFDGDEMIGFSYGFVGFERGRVTLHSDMLAVRETYRGRGVGYRLKLRQREAALAAGIDFITWTFDPLRAANARFNIAKLGAYADNYKVDFYGEATSSFLHAQIGTDRLWVGWPIGEPRVARRVEQSEGGPAGGEEIAVSLDEFPQPLVFCAADLRPITSVINRPDEPQTIEVPMDIGRLQREEPELAAAWRRATRAAFLEAFAERYLVDDFRTTKRGDGASVGVYLLVRPGAPRVD